MQNFVSGLLCLGLLSIPFTSNAQEVIPDAALREVVQEIVQKKTGKPDLTNEVLADIYFLRAPEKGIADLTGLEKMTNLVEVDLRGNKITNLAPLKGLGNLQLLDLQKNTIADVAPLAELKKLQYLQLEHNQVVDIKPLEGLSAMMSLYLSHNKIEDIAPVAKLEKLSSLYLAGNGITNLAPLGGLKRLDTLDARQNKIVDLAPLKTLTDMRLTMLQSNAITDLTPLVEMATADANGPKRFAPYWELYVGGNPLSDAAKTTQAEALRALGVRLHLEDPAAKPDAAAPETPPAEKPAA